MAGIRPSEIFETENESSTFPANEMKRSAFFDYFAPRKRQKESVSHDKRDRNDGDGLNEPDDHALHRDVTQVSSNDDEEKNKKGGEQTPIPSTSGAIDVVPITENIESDDDDSVTDVSGPVVEKRKCEERSEESTMAVKQTQKKKYEQQFCEKWLETYKDWLQCEIIKGKSVAKCRVCNKYLKNPNKSDLQKHENSASHQSIVRQNADCVDLALFTEKTDHRVDIDKNCARAELKLVGYMAEHRIPFRHADHLTSLLSTIFTDSKMAKTMKMKKTKASYIMQYGIAHHEKEYLGSILRKRKFSVMIDETTDVSVTQILAIVARYHHEQKVSDILLAVVEVEDGKAEGLFRHFTDVLDKMDIPIKNVIGFGGDNCSTMMGRHSGFQARLKEKNPNLFVQGCVCHSLALAANAASKVLPSWLEKLLKDIGTFFKKSAKRTREFKLIQEAVNAPSHRILKLSTTRWLSRSNVIARILEQWDALKLFFSSEIKSGSTEKDDRDKASSCLKTMEAFGTQHVTISKLCLAESRQYEQIISE